MLLRRSDERQHAAAGCVRLARVDADDHIKRRRAQQAFEDERFDGGDGASHGHEDRCARRAGDGDIERRHVPSVISFNRTLCQRSSVQQRVGTRGYNYQSMRIWGRQNAT
eukprot:scaffold65709_cov74-Phaeocystis_antarctica.AAC.2